MNEYINLTLENIDKEHICCAIGDPKHQNYSQECPYVVNCINEIQEYAKENNILLNIIKIDTLEKAKEVPCVFNNWVVYIVIFIKEI